MGESGTQVRDRLLAQGRRQTAAVTDRRHQLEVAQANFAGVSRQQPRKPHRFVQRGELEQLDAAAVFVTRQQGIDIEIRRAAAEELGCVSIERPLACTAVTAGSGVHDLLSSGITGLT
jgi:hypothetical protein